MAQAPGVGCLVPGEVRIFGGFWGSRNSKSEEAATPIPCSESETIANTPPSCSPRAYVLPNLCFATRWPSRGRRDSRKQRRQLRKPQTQGLSAGNHENYGNRECKQRLPQKRLREIRSLRRVLYSLSSCSTACGFKGSAVECNH